MAQNDPTEKRTRAVVALLECRTFSEAAKQADIGRATLRRWLAEDDEFRRMVLDAEGRAIDASARKLIRLSDRAVDSIEAVLYKPTADGASIRLRAAGVVLDQLMRLRELRNVESRLAALEAAAEGRMN